MPKHSVGENDMSFITLVNVFKMFSNKPSFCQNYCEAAVARNVLEKQGCLLGCRTDWLECTRFPSFLLCFVLQKK